MNASPMHSTGVPSDIDLEAILSDLVFDTDEVIEAAAPEGAPEDIVEPEEIEPELEAVEAEVIAEAAVEPEVEPEAELAAVEVEAEVDTIPDLAELPEEPSEPVIEALSLDADEERHLDAALGQLEAYEAQESEVEVAADEDEIEASPEAVAPAARTTRAPKAPKAPAAPRASKDISTLPAERFVLSGTLPSDLEANKASVLASRPTQVKIAEKFDNVISSLAAGRKPSGYVMKCFAVLQARGEVTSGDLVAALQTEYSVGTSRSQAGQMMELFNVLGIAVRTKQSLKLIPDSTYAAELGALLTA